MSIINISFDYDETLDTPVIQELCKELISKENINVFIVTSRYQLSELKKLNPYVNHDYNYDITSTAQKLGIPQENIYFTNHTYKATWFEKNSELNINYHIDNEFFECTKIQQNINVNVKPLFFSVNNFNSVDQIREKLNKILNYERYTNTTKS